MVPASGRKVWRRRSKDRAADGWQNSPVEGARRHAMALITDSTMSRATEADGLLFARDVLRIEADAIDRVRDQLDLTIARAADLVYRCPGSVIVTGMGKAGIVGQKLAATLASTGTRAFPLHPAEAIHGDLGRIRADDVVIALSQSGETEEVLRLVPALRRLEAVLIAITERKTSSLGLSAQLCVSLGPIEEACPLGLAPSASTTAMMAVGDALALLVSRMRDFRAEDFALYQSGRQSRSAAGLCRGPDADQRPAPAGPRRALGPRGLRQPGRAEATIGCGPDRR